MGRISQVQGVCSVGGRRKSVYTRWLQGYELGVLGRSPSWGLLHSDTVAWAAALSQEPSHTWGPWAGHFQPLCFGVLLCKGVHSMCY